MQGPLWQPPLEPVSASPNRYLAGVCVPLPIWFLTGFILLFLIPGTVSEYRLTHDQGGVAGTVTVTRYDPPSGMRGDTGECLGSFRPAEDVPAHRRERVEVFVKGECQVGAKLAARVCPEPGFQYRDECERYAWTEGAGTWKSPLVPVCVAGPAWLVCTILMPVFFVKWRRAVRRAARDPFGGG